MSIYLSLPGACPRWKERASSCTIRWKERASSRSHKHVFHPDEFLRSRVHRSKYIRERAHAASVSVTYVRTHTHTDTTNCKYRYTTYHCQSSLKHILPVTARKSYGRPQCAIFTIVATVIYYFSLLVTACHQLFTYHCLAPVLAEHCLVLFAGKSEHHLDLVNTYFTPTNFYVYGSQVKVHPGARACGFRFHHIRTHAHTHGHNQYR